MSTTVVVLAWLGLALGAVIAVVVVLLFNQLVSPLRQVDRYAAHILDAGVGIARNLDGVDEAMRTRELATAVPGLAAAYLKRLGAA